MANRPKKPSADTSPKKFNTLHVTDTIPSDSDMPSNTPTANLSQETINALAEERYRVLEAKVNKSITEINHVSRKLDETSASLKKDISGSHENLSGQLTQLSMEMRTRDAKESASTRRTIITAASTLIGSLLTITIVLLYIFL
jgi:VIT1/CCC1 family predicted Fe2+/Mn2+ transporter